MPLDLMMKYDGHDKQSASMTTLKDTIRPLDGDKGLSQKHSASIYGFA